jgi:beta-lactamase regulating signal transducer with metallopeptidase domain
MIREALWALPLPHLLTLLSLALAAILACGAGLSGAWFLRRRAVPVQYGLLLSALALTLTAPLLTQTARMTNMGRIEVSVAPAPPQPAAPQPAPVETRPVVQSSPVVVAPPAIATRPAVRAESLSMLWRRYFSWRTLGTALAVVWALGIVMGLARLLIGAVLVWRLKRSSEPSVSARVLDSATTAARLLGLRDTPEIRVSSLTVSPMVMGVARPAILLPSGLEERLDDAHLAAALLHETAHIAHRDTLIGLFQRVAATLFWWCPLVHLVNRRLDDLREDICDNYVIRAQGDGLCLAQVLVHVAERTQDWARMRWIGAMAMTEPTGKGFEGRVRRLLQKERNTVTRMNLAAVCATMTFAALLGGAILVTTVRAADRSEDAANAKTPELCVRPAKQQGQFDLELRLPGKGSNPRMTVEAGKWGMLEVALDAATQLSFRARVNADKQQVRVSSQVTVAVTRGFQQWAVDDEPWPLGEWKALKETATSQPAAGEFSGVKEIRFSRGIPGNLTGKTVTIKETIKDPAEIDWLLATIKLEEKNPSGCRHLESAVFVKDKGNIEVSLCEHCFDFGGKTYRMPTGFYQLFKAYLGDSVAWGEAVAGLAVGVRACQDDIRPGESIDLALHLRNVSDKPIRVGMSESGLWELRELAARARVTGPDGKVVEPKPGRDTASVAWRDGGKDDWPTLKPGQTIGPLHVQLQTDPEVALTKEKWYDISTPGEYTIELVYALPTDMFMEGRPADAWAGGKAVSGKAAVLHRGDAKPVATQPIDQAKDAKAYVIDTQGRHTLFSDQRVTVIGDVHERGSNLVYTMSIQDAKGSLTKGPWPLQPGTKWFMYVETPNVWVFDGDDTVRLVHLDSSGQDRGLSDRTVKEFPEIMKTAPKPFLDRLPDNINLGVDGKSVEAPNLQSSHDVPATEKPTTQESPRADSWGCAVNSLQTRLIAEKDRVKAGEPVRLKLELRNVGPENRSYDSQQVDVNDSLIVRGPKGEEIPFVAGRVSTLGGGHSIKPGETVVLFDGLDATGQYLLTAPGVHTFQFRGIGKEGFAFRGKGEPSIPPSNEVQVELAGETTVTMKREAALLKATPDGWHFARIAGGDGRVTPAGRQEGRGYEYVWTTVAGLKSYVQTVRLWITEKPTAGVAGATEESEDLGPTRAGHAYVWASVGAWEAWRHLRTDIRAALGGVEDWFDQQIRSGRVVEGKPLALGGGLALSVFCQAQAAPPTPEKPTPLIVGVRVTNTGEKEIKFQPASLKLMLQWGDGPMQDVGINMNGRPRAKPPLVLKSGEKWTWTVADAQLGFGGKPVYLAFHGVAEPDVADGYRPGLFFERELEGKADRIAFAACYEQGKPESLNCEPVVCRLVADQETKKGVEQPTAPATGPAAAPGAREPAAGAVRVRILSGTDRDPARDAVEEWIAKGLAEAGSPVTSALSDWMTLSDQERELYSSMRGGRIIKGRVSDKGEVEITGMKIGQSPRIIAVRPGQKQVVKVTDYPGAGNVFIAVEAPAIPAAVPPVRVTDADNGKTITTVVGQTIEVRLRFSGWEAQAVEGGVLEFAGKRLEPGLDGETSSDKPMHMSVFTYRAVKAGQAKVQMKYEPTGKAFAVAVDVGQVAPPMPDLDQWIRSGRVVEGKPLALGGGMALSCFCQAQAAPPALEKPTPLIVGVRVANTGEKDIEFQPASLRLMLKWGDGLMQDMVINQDKIPQIPAPFVLKPGEKWTWTVADAGLNFRGKPVYLAFSGASYLDGQWLEHKLNGKADRIAFAAQYHAGKAMSQPCEPVVCRLAADQETQKGPGQPTALAAGRAAKLLGDLKTFTLQLNYSGQQEKPYYHLLLSVPPLPGKDRDNPFYRQARVTEQQARVVIEYLVKDGYFDVALDGHRNASPARPTESYYSLDLRVENDGNPVGFEEWLPLAKPLLYQRLDGLRGALEGDAAKDMDLLIGRLAGERRALKQPADTRPAAKDAATRPAADARRETIAGVVWYFDQEFAKPEAQRNSHLKQFLGERTIADLFVHRAELDRENWTVWLGLSANQIEHWDLEANFDLKYQRVSSWAQGQGPVGDVKALMNVPTADVRKWPEYTAVVERQCARQVRLDAIWPRTEAEAARVLKAVRPELAENVAGMWKGDFYPDRVQRQVDGPNGEHLCEFQFTLDAKDQPRLRLMHQWNWQPKEKLPAIDDAKAWEPVAIDYFTKTFGHAPRGKLVVYSLKDLPPDLRNRKDDSKLGPFLRFVWTEQPEGQAADARQVMTFEVHEQAANRYWIWCSDSDPAAARPEPQATQPAMNPAAIDPKTASLADALTDWIALLEKDDAKTATARWVTDAPAQDKMTTNWKALRECHKQHDYRRWLENSSDESTAQLVPGGAKRIGKDTAFRVGGHGFGHLHVMWEKTHSGWRIASILECM